MSKLELEIKFKATKSSNYNWVRFYDGSGYEVHRIIAAFDSKHRKGYDGKWCYKDAYFENNKVHVTKYDSKEARLVSYPIKRTNKYYVKKGSQK